MEGEEVVSHCRGERVIFFMDYVMYFLLTVVKELGEAWVVFAVVTWTCFC